VKQLTAVDRRSKGFTLVEVVVSFAIITAIFGMLARVTLATSGSTDYLVVDASARREMQRAFERLQDELHRSAPTVVVVATDGAGQDVLTLQVAGAWNGAASWGAIDDSGVWRDDWSTRYRVQGSQLVRETLDAADAVQGGASVLVRGVGAPAGGAKGFEVARIGTIVTLRLRVTRSFADGVAHADTLATSVHVKNSAAP